MKVRLPKLIGVVLALASFAWAGGATCAACQSASPVAAQDATRHDCCRAHLGKHTARHDGASHANAHSESCGAGHSDRSPLAGDAVRVAAVGDDGSTPANCCAGLPARTPAHAVAATNDASRIRISHLASARTVSLDTLTLHPVIAPTQHAPPSLRARLHILNSVLLI